MVPWNSAKAKVQLRLSVQRLRTLQQKKEAQAKAARREIATLVEKGKIETARIKVESLIHEDIHIELLELLELYCELLLARFGLLDQNAREPDPELYILRDILMHKYGREFTIDVMENKEGCVSDRVARKVNTETPSVDLVDGYLTEITRAYGVDWTANKGDAGAKDQIVPDVNDGQAESQPTQSGSSVDGPPPFDDSSKKPPESLPDKNASKGNEEKKSADANKSSSPPPKKPGGEDDFDALAKRFAALKRR